jgi:hypothetical protein
MNALRRMRPTMNFFPFFCVIAVAVGDGGRRRASVGSR